MNRPRWLMLGGLLAAVSLAVVLLLQLPSAAGVDDRAAELSAREQRLAALESETDAIGEKVTEKKALLAEVRRDKADLVGRIEKQERQIETLQARIEELGG